MKLKSLFDLIAIISLLMLLLKIAGLISLSWFWVLSPVWGTVLVVILYVYFFIL